VVTDPVLSTEDDFSIISKFIGFIGGKFILCMT
jgi:hypothetical protein